MAEAISSISNRIMKIIHASVANLVNALRSYFTTLELKVQTKSMNL